MNFITEEGKEDFIRDLTVNDIQDIVRLCNECLPTASYYRLEFYEKILKSLNSRCLGVYFDKKLIAMAAFKICHKPRKSLSKLNLPFDKLNLKTYIILFCVKESYRRLGYGTHLMNKIIEYSKQESTKLIYLHMSAANNVALKFYNNFKFEIIDKVDNYYKGMINKNPTAYILVLNLNIQ